MKKTLIFTIITVLISVPILMMGQSNFVDLSFNPSDVNSNVYNGIKGCDNVQFNIQKDDNIIVTCEASEDAIYNNTKISSNVFRITPNGLMDTTFQSNTKIKFVRYVGFQSDGKIIIKGKLDNYPLDNNIDTVIRLNTNGSIDTSYKLTEEVDPFELIKVYPDDKLLVCQREYSGGSLTTTLIRLENYGSRDSTFNNSLDLNGECTFIKVFDNGKILLGGDFTICGGFPRRFLALLNSDGTVDESFNIGVGFNKAPTKIISLKDGSILAYGVFTSFNEHNLIYNSTSQNLIKLNNNGKFDQDFNLQNSLENKLNLLFPLKNNQFLIGSGKINYNVVPVSFECKIEKFNADGSKADSFSAIELFLSRYATENFPHHIEAQSKERFFIGSSAYKLNGKIDYSFNSTTSFSQAPTTVDIDSQGKIILANGSSYFGKPINQLIRLLPDGEIDTTFNVNEQIPFGIKSICTQPDGKILVGGSSYSGSYKYEAGLVRLNTDGSFDDSFSPVVNNYSEVKLIKSYGNNKLIVVFGGIIKRLNSDGSFDDSFIQRNGNIEDIFILPDGKILAAGAFYSGNKLIGNVIRIKEDGSIDYSFASISSLLPKSMRILDNDKIIGCEANSNGLLKVCLLSHSGNLISDFDSKIKVPDFSHAGSHQSLMNFNAIGIQNKILITGNIGVKKNEWGEYSQQKIVLLDENGTIDTTYTCNYGNSNGVISDMRKQPDNRIIIFGHFDSVDNIIRNKIARINIGFLVSSNNYKLLSQKFKVWPNPTTGYITIESLNEIDGSIIIYNNLGNKIIEKAMDGEKKHFINLSNYPNGIYFININNEKGNYTHKLILK